ncbi:MAG TPA: hypothetical protein VIM53_01420 [Candidatus Saccharimonadales bacterium]
MKTSASPSAKIDPRKVAAIRLVFGGVWAIDAAFKCTPMFYRMLMQNVQGAAVGMPAWLGWWFNFWQRVISVQPHAAAVGVAVAECAIALSLLLGIFRRTMYIFGGAFALLIWAVGEAFGGPYSSMSTDIGTGCIYTVVFALLFVTDVTPTWTLGARFLAKKNS